MPRLPRTPAWGSMVSAGRDYLLTAWWVSTLPGVAILILVLVAFHVGGVIFESRRHGENLVRSMITGMKRR